MPRIVNKSSNAENGKLSFATLKQIFINISFSFMERNNTFTIMLEELNYQEMSEIKGGVSREEYCAELKRIMRECDLSDGAWEGAIIGYSRNCL